MHVALGAGGWVVGGGAGGCVTGGGVGVATGTGVGAGVGAATEGGVGRGAVGVLPPPHAGNDSTATTIKERIFRTAASLWVRPNVYALAGSKANRGRTTTDSV